MEPESEEAEPKRQPFASALGLCFSPSRSSGPHAPSTTDTSIGGTLQPGQTWDAAPSLTLTTGSLQSTSTAKKPRTSSRTLQQKNFFKGILTRIGQPAAESLPSGGPPPPVADSPALAGSPSSPSDFQSVRHKARVLKHQSSPSEQQPSTPVSSLGFNCLAQQPPPAAASSAKSYLGLSFSKCQQSTNSNHDKNNYANLPSASTSLRHKAVAVRRKKPAPISSLDPLSTMNNVNQLDQTICKNTNMMHGQPSSMPGTHSSDPIRSLPFFQSKMYEPIQSINCDLSKLEAMFPDSLACVRQRRYAIRQVLGEGGFGYVLSAVLSYPPESALPDQRFAIKMLKKDRVTNWVNSAPSERIPMEIHVMQHIQHPNIVRLVDVFEDNQFYFMVMEEFGTTWTSEQLLCPPCVPSPSPSSRRSLGTDLFACIQLHGRLSELIARKIFYQLVYTVQYLHQIHGLCHRDIKEENILMDSGCHVKLIDFGTSAWIPPLDSPHLWHQKFSGTVHYCPPEVLLGHAYRGPEADLWSLGVLLFTMVFGRNPFTNPQITLDTSMGARRLACSLGFILSENGKIHTWSVPQAVHDALIDRGLPVDALNREDVRWSLNSTGLSVSYMSVSHELMDLLERLLDRNPCRRYSMDALIHHPWLQQHYHLEAKHNDII